MYHYQLSELIDQINNQQVNNTAINISSQMKLTVMPVFKRQTEKLQN